MGEPPDDAKQNALEKIIRWVVASDPGTIKTYVDKLRSQNLNISNEELAKKIVSRKSLKNGFIGAVTSLGGALVLPVAIPANLIATWKIQAFMAFSVAYAFGHTHETTDLMTDIYLIMAGDAGKEVIKKLGIEASKEVTKKAVEKYITKDIMKKIWKYAGRKIITKAGEKSLISFTRMVPLVGAPVGFFFDWSSAKVVGHAAIKYYSG